MGKNVNVQTSMGIIISRHGWEFNLDVQEEGLEVEMLHILAVDRFNPIEKHTCAMCTMLNRIN